MYVCEFWFILSVKMDSLSSENMTFFVCVFFSFLFMCVFSRISVILKITIDRHSLLPQKSTVRLLLQSKLGAQKWTWPTNPAPPLLMLLLPASLGSFVPCPILVLPAPPLTKGSKFGVRPVREWAYHLTGCLDIALRLESTVLTINLNIKILYLFFP